MKTAVKHLEMKNESNKHLYRRLFELQVELERFTKDHLEYSKEIEVIIDSIDQFFERVIEKLE